MIPVGTRFSALVQTDPEAQPVSSLFHRVKQQGRGVTPPPKLAQSYTSTALWSVLRHNSRFNFMEVRLFI